MNWTKHPIIPLPTKEKLQTLLDTKGAQAVFDLWKSREEAIKLSKEDPLTYGFKLDHWNDAIKLFEKFDIVICLGGNRSGKTEFGGMLTADCMESNEDANILSFSQDNDSSIRIQQPAVYKYLLPCHKKKTKSEVAYLNYTIKNGFTNQDYILPNKSQNFFQTYSQFQQNKGKFEGLELGSYTFKKLNLAFWFDEYLQNGDLFKTMKFRLITRNSKGLLTFTPVNGYTPFVAEILKNVETVKTRPAELLDGEEVPYIQHNHEMGIGIIYFHTELNPFGGYERLKKDLKNASREEILTRAYGIPVKSMTTLFPLFNTSVHVIDKSPTYSSNQWTAYQVVDPAGARNYTCLWAMVNKDGDVHVLREWPDKNTYGPWAEFGDPKWKHGPAADKLGYNIDRYIELFEDIESDLGIEVYERFIDSRFASREGNNNSTLFDDFADSGMDFLPTDGKEIDRGISGLDQWFWYNANESVDSANKPQLTIHKSCGNLIHSLINWGNNGKKDEALKDFVDCLRYLRMCNDGDGPDHITSRSLEATRVGNGGY